MIKNAINSVLSQNYENYELIIVDDASIDGTDTEIQRCYKNELSSGIIRYYYQNEKKGAAECRNIGLSLANGEWICYIDSDNMIAMDFLSTFVEAINKNPDCRIFYAQSVMMSNGMKGIARKFNMDLLKTGNYVDLGVFIHHSDLVNEVGNFDTSLKRLQDWDLILRYVKNNAPIFIDKVLLFYNDNNEIDRISNKENICHAYTVIAHKYSDVHLPRISTIILSYNQEDYISKALESAIMQNGFFIHEIIVSDDGSTDRTLKIIEKYAKRYPKLIKNISSKETIGTSENFRRGILASSGNYIAFLKGDDYWMDSYKNYKQLQCLENNLQCNMCFSKILLLDHCEKFTNYCHHSEEEKTLNKDDYSNLKLDFVTNFSCTMFRRNTVINLPQIIYDEKMFEIAVEMYCAKRGEAKFLNETMVAHCIHNDKIWSEMLILEKK